MFDAETSSSQGAEDDARFETLINNGFSPYLARAAVEGYFSGRDQSVEPNCETDTVVITGFAPPVPEARAAYVRGISMAREALQRARTTRKDSEPQSESARLHAIAQERARRERSGH